MASKPAARSAMMSSIFSVPMDRRTVVGLMPAASSSSLGQLGVRGGSRVDDQRLHVGDVRQQAEQAQGFGELAGIVGGALHVEGEDGAGAVGVILVIELLGAAGCQCRMVHGGNLRMVVQELHHLQRASPRDGRRAKTASPGPSSSNHALNGESVAPWSRSSVARAFVM